VFVSPPRLTVEGEDTKSKTGGPEAPHNRDTGDPAVADRSHPPGATSRNDHRGSNMIRRLLKDESGQTMLEYIVIIVFVVIAAIIAFRLVKNIVKKNIDRVSASFDTD
jgi:Flp pilus assembly pilin Flp